MQVREEVGGNASKGKMGNTVSQRRGRPWAVDLYISNLCLDPGETSARQICMPAGTWCFAETSRKNLFIGRETIRSNSYSCKGLGMRRWNGLAKPAVETKSESKRDRYESCWKNIGNILAPDAVVELRNFRLDQGVRKVTYFVKYRFKQLEQ